MMIAFTAIPTSSAVIPGERERFSVRAREGDPETPHRAQSWVPFPSLRSAGDDKLGKS
jgi:hypothetical protein